MAETAARIAYRTCPLCEAMCGLRIHVDGDRVTRVEPDPDDVWSHGYICPKGAALGALHHDPDRLRRPLIKQADGSHRECDWREAFEAVERKLRPVLDAHGPTAAAVYIGNPTAHNLSLGFYVGALIGMAQAAGLEQIYSAGTVDQWPNNVVSALLYGGMWTISVPDVDRTDYLLMLGANPSASQGSLLAAPDVIGRLRALRRRGGKLVVVDPRRTATAELADLWLPIRPGTDALLLAAILHTLDAEGLIADPDADASHLRGLVSGLEAALSLVRPLSPERVAAACAVDAQTIRTLARELAAAECAAVYGRIGTCTQEFGTLSQYLIEVVNLSTGNLDREGGKMFPQPVTASLLAVKPPDQPAEGWAFARRHSRVRGAPEVLGQFPVSCLAEEIATEGEGRLRALVTVAGNPCVSAPEAAALERALPQLDCMVSVDSYLNETTRHADVVLPGLSPLEQPHHDDLLWMFAVRSSARWSDAVFEPAPGAARPREWEILLRLAGAFLGMNVAECDVAALDDAYFTGILSTLAADTRSAIHGRDPSEIFGATAGSGPERLLDFAIRTGPWGEQYGRSPEGLTLAEVKRQPHGLDLGPMRGGRLAEVLRTSSGTIELDHALVRDDFERLARRLDREEAPLLLTSRRHLRSNNSWMHNLEPLMTGRERCTLLIHPDDARARGLADGALARVRTSAGEIVVAASVSDEMMPGVVSLPHGWGHDRPGTRLSVARCHPGANNNVLNPGHLLDAPSGNAVVNGVPVDVEPASPSDRRRCD